MKRFAFLAIPFALAACGDNLSVNTPIDASVTDPDAASIDAQEIDAREIDAREIDAPPAVTYGGTISVLEAALLNPGTSGTFFGQGVQASITFTQSDQVPAPMLEEMPGSPLGCKAWVYTPAQTIAATVGIDEGQVNVRSPAGTSTNLLAPCVFTAGVGYTCPHNGTLSTGGTIAAGPAAGTATLTDTDVTFDLDNTTNRYVRISGATNAANNGVFPIVGFSIVAPNTIVYANPAFVAETIPAAGFHINLSGVGPTPGAIDPGFLLDTASVDFVKAAGGGDHIAAFTATTTAGGSVGDDFTLPLADLNALNALPRDGSAFTISCPTCVTPAGGSGTLINIVTTDAPTAGLSPFSLPAPVTERVQVRCAALGQNAVTVPAAYSAFLMRAGITRIQATLIRPTLMGGGPSSVTSISGHAIVGYTN